MLKFNRHEKGKNMVASVVVIGEHTANKFRFYNNLYFFTLPYLSRIALMYCTFLLLHYYRRIARTLTKLLFTNVNMELNK